MRTARLALTALLASALCASAAAAATLTESATAGGAFSGRWDSPTEVGSGYDLVSGTGSQNVFDNFVFSALPSGAQKLSFSFAAPEQIGHSYSAGGAVLYSDRPFRWGWDGTTAKSVQVDYHTRSKTFDLDLGDGFSGKLYLALNFTHGSNLAYTIGVPSNAAPTPVAPVPLPAGMTLIGTAAALLAGLGLRRRLRPA